MLKRISKRTPGGRVVVHRVPRNPKLAHCASCGDELKGVPRGRPVKMQNMPKTKKRPQRPFGGVLCTRCMRDKIKNSTR